MTPPVTPPVEAPADPAERLRAVRATREQLCHAAAAGHDAELERAVAGLVTAAWDAGFLRATVISLVSVALESARPAGVRAARRRVVVERWVRRAGALYDRRAAAGHDA